MNFINLIFTLLSKKIPKKQEIISNENNSSKPSEKPSNVSSNEQPTIYYILPNIENIIDKLPKHPTRKWNQRKIQSIKKIIVHHSATTATENGFKDIEQIAKYHVSLNNHISPQGCPGICYSLIISKNGDIYQTNEFTSVTWHTKGQNTIALGVCILGGYNEQQENEKQLTSLNNLLFYLMNILKLEKKDVYGHQDFSSTECPGSKIYDWLQEWKRK